MNKLSVLGGILVAVVVIGGAYLVGAYTHALRTTAQALVPQTVSQPPVPVNNISSHPEVIACIEGAQAERDRREANIDMVADSCLQDSDMTASFCSSLRDYSVVETKYLDWKSNCELGIPNDYSYHGI